ncbi:MAG: DUF1778 domain-containing protein [Blastocatellia bacterium]
MSTDKTKNQTMEVDRMNFRLSTEIKAKIIKAAAITGQQLTDFAVSTLNEKANEILEQHNNIVLKSEDYEFFLASLSEEKEPSLNSLKAASRYKQGRRKGVKYYIAD